MTFIKDILTFMLEALGKAWPYILISIPLSVAVNVSGAGTRIRSIVGRNPAVSIFLATLFGALSPLCSCTVIPVIFALLTSGVPLGPVMAFWIASPSMDPEIFFLSISVLGWNLAVWRLAATFILSLGAGFLAHMLDRTGWFSEGILREQPTLRILTLRDLFNRKTTEAKQENAHVAENDCGCAATGTDDAVPAAAASFCCSTGEPAVLPASGPTLFSGTIETAPVETPGEPLARRILKESFTALVFVGKFMLIAYFIEALIFLYVPESFIGSILGRNQALSIGLATGFGLPFYTTNLAALGLLGGLLEKGMVPGAALAFLVSGPMTTLPAMSAVFGIARKRVFVLYLGIAFVGALLFGGLYALIGGGM